MLDRPKSEHDQEVVDPQSPPDPDASIGDLIGRIVTDGRELAEAEVALAKAKLRSDVMRYKAPAIMVGAAIVFAVAALVAFAVGITLALATLIGPLAGGLVATILFLAIAGILGWLASRKLERNK